MALGCFSRFWCPRRPPPPSDGAIVPPVLVSAPATRPNSDSHSGNNTEGVRNATTKKITRPGTVNIPVPAPAQGSLSSSAAGLTPALTEVQPTGIHFPEGDMDIPALAHAEEVHSTLPPAQPAYRLDPARAQKCIDRISRFRILIMGRANAGKTTVLQRVCNTTDQLEIFDGEGKEVDPTVVQGSLTRGEHNIEDELIFRSNPGFVFHDSRGFEAGSEQQFNMMKKFVADRAKATELDKRIHAIWFCIPSNESHRMIMAAERKFFDECDTGHVPVIVLLTKADQLTLDAVQELLNQGLSFDDAMKGAAEVEKRILEDCFLQVKDYLKGRNCPPVDYLSLSGMQREGADCAPLIKCTANALSEEGLQQLLISTQQSNLELCIGLAIMKTLKQCMKEQGHKIAPESLAMILAMWFPYNYEECEEKKQEHQERHKRLPKLQGILQDLDQQQQLKEEKLEQQRQRLKQQFQVLLDQQQVSGVMGGSCGCKLNVLHQPVVFGSQKEEFEFQLKLAVQQHFDMVLLPPIELPLPSLSIPTLSDSMQYSMQYIAEHGIGAILVFEYLYFFLQTEKRRNDIQEDLTLAVREYQSSGVHAKVNGLIQEAFQKYGEDVEVLCPILVDIAKENYMSKNLY